ncbi:MAG: hypothetical protein D6761_06795 [Candidatus Dadabacteria bacterium]|nr:MAG: hypothetical protein D6761_06795 [Candidatus Dadabacteria bacterium]
MRCCSINVCQRRFARGLVYVEALVVLPVLVILLSGIIRLAETARVRLAAERLWHAVVLAPRSGRQQDWIERIAALGAAARGSCRREPGRVSCLLPGRGELRAEAAIGSVQAAVQYCTSDQRCAIRSRRWIGLTAPGGVW